jgi:hypothetical protein
VSSPLEESLALVTDREARLHLHIDAMPESPPSAADELVTMKIEHASNIVADYIKDPGNGWTAETAPRLIKAAVLLVLGIIYDDAAADPLTPGVKNILRRWRDPAMA